MARRLLAGGLGAVVAVGFYAVAPALSPGPSRLTAATPMQATALAVRAASIKIVDPTPARLLIPAISVDATIESRGLDSQRNLATPADFRHVAWYNLGPRPGEPGNAVLNGHVNWWTGDAVFTHLARLNAGDDIHVVRVDGRVVNFKVTSKHIVDANARIASLFVPSSNSTITLITCSGEWNPLTRSDTQRLLVSAALA
jgi:sortase A